jgi:hypothetical protein
MFAAQKVPRQCLIFLLVKVAWQKGKTLGREEGKLLGSGPLGVCSRGQ